MQVDLYIWGNVGCAACRYSCIRDLGSGLSSMGEKSGSAVHSIGADKHDWHLT